MSEWCLQHREVPDDVNEPFLACYQINIDGEDPENYPDNIRVVENPVKSMRLFITTKHLMKLASQHCSLIQADATYKLVWIGYPVLIIGFSDMDKVFHPICIALCKDETGLDYQFIFRSLQIGIDRCGFGSLQKVNLMADAADAITNGFKTTFYSEDDVDFKRGL